MNRILKYLLNQQMKSVIIAGLLIVFFSSCEQPLYLKFDNSNIKQVINSYFTEDDFLRVNISKSKQPNDFAPIEFLQDCQVDLYEDDVFRETLPFLLKDTLSGLGYYTSTFKLTANKTYKIISSHADLPTAEASEFLPARIEASHFLLLQHGDAIHPNLQCKYSISIADSAAQQNFYFISTYYKFDVPILNTDGDTTYKTVYNWKLQDYNINLPFKSNRNPALFSDSTFNGQARTFDVAFQSQYNDSYKEIILVIELSNTGKNYYEWTSQHQGVKTDYLNEGQLERVNPTSNIINGFGHFSAFNNTYISIKIK